MLQIKSFSSGSSGNCSYVETSSGKILIDVGISYHRIVKGLELLSKTLDDLDGILITHTHKDHIAGLRVLAKHTKTKFYIQEGMYKEVKELIPKEQIEFLMQETHIKKMSITTIPTSHDITPSCGFLIEEGEESLVYITDTGYLKEKTLQNLKNKTIYFIESNHDEELLMNGSYPYQLKQRILGDKGHLSNHLTARYLKEMIGKDTKYIILAHLSQDNNKEELALETVSSEIKKTPYSPFLSVARQNEETELIEV